MHPAPMILLTPLDLGIAALLVTAAAALTYALRLEVGRTMLVSALRCAVQLLLIGYVLKALFAHPHLTWVMLLALIMLAVAGHEASARQHRRLAGWWGFGLGAFSMFLSSFTVTVLALTVVIGPTPWYEPQYAIPLLGMLLGNTMNGIALGMDRLTQTAWEQRAVIETRLMLGHRSTEAISEIRRNSIRSGMIPIINSMAAAGVVSLPGMMTGQILAGAAPVAAVQYQVMILFLITTGTVLGTVGAVWFASRRLFDARERLRLDRLAARA